MKRVPPKVQAIVQREGVTDAILSLPYPLSDRYIAKLTNDEPPTVEIRTRDGRAAVTFVGDEATIIVATDASAGHVQHLWSEAHAILGVANQGGRPSGSPNRVRADLVREVRDHPAMTDEAIDARGIALDLWADAPGDYEVIGKRVRRIREDARPGQ